MSPRRGYGPQLHNSPSQMNRPSNSKDRFATFLENFRSGEYKQKSLDDKSEPKDKDAAETKEQKSKRRGYLKQYIRQLWPHRKMVLLLVALAVTVAVLEIASPLFGRYIIDQILLTEKTNAEKFWQLNIVGGLFLLVVFITRICGMTRAWFQRLPQRSRDSYAATSPVRTTAETASRSAFGHESRRHHLATDRRHQ